MLTPFSFLVFLHEVRVRGRVRFVRLICITILAAFVIIYACNSNKAAVPHWEKERRTAGISVKHETSHDAAADRPARSRRAASLSTIKASEYEANLYWAIPFTPRGDGEGLIQADSGSQFVLLDMSIQNTTTDRNVNVGEILLSAKIRDGEGREYPSDPLIVAAFNLEYPYPNHKEQYSSLKGVLRPGEVCRTVVFGFEAPVDIKNFVLFLEGSRGHEDRRYEAAFYVK